MAAIKDEMHPIMQKTRADMLNQMQAQSMQWKALLKPTSQQKDTAIDLLKEEITQLKADWSASQMQLDKCHAEDNRAATSKLHEQLQDLKIPVEQKNSDF